MKLKKILIIISFLISLNISAQIVRKYSNEFLNIGAGGRALAMGGSVTASQSDIYSPLWNPAGLTGIENDWQAAAMHAEYFQSVAKYDYLAYAKRINNGVLAFSLIRLGVDDILNTTRLIDNDGNINYDNVTTFTAADYAAYISYGFRPAQSEKLSVGLNAKIIYRNVGKFANAFGFGFDVGARLQADNGFVYGAVLKDALTTVNVWSINQAALSTVINGTDINPAPKDKMEESLPKLNLGVSKKWELNRDINILPEVGVNMEFQKTAALLSSNFISVTPSAGLEGSYQNLIFLRLGVNRFQNITDFETNGKKMSFQPSAGIGFQYKGFYIDYAISNSGLKDSNFYSNFFSLKFNMEEFIDKK